MNTYHTSTTLRHLRVRSNVRFSRSGLLIGLLVACLGITGCNRESLSIQTVLDTSETITTGDSVVDHRNMPVGEVSAIKEDPELGRIAVLSLERESMDPSSFEGRLLRVQGANPIRLVVIEDRGGEEEPLKDGDILPTKTQSGVLLDRVLQESISPTKIVYLILSLCLTLGIILLLGRLVLRAGLTLVILALSVVAGWIGTGVFTPAVAAWLKAHPPVNLSSDRVPEALSSLFKLIPQDLDPALVAFLLVACFSFVLLIIVAGFVRRTFTARAR